MLNLHACLQRLHQGSGHALPLGAAAHIESIQITVRRHIGEAQQLFPLHCNQGDMGSKALIPGVEIHSSICPGIQRFG